MNKAELLADLLGRAYIRSFSAEALLETKPDGTKTYQVNACEFSQKSAIYRNISFYVIDEGTTEEVAFYKDGDVKRTLPITDFKEFVSANYKSVVPAIVDYSWVSADEEKRSGVIKAVIPDVLVDGEYTVKGYIVADNDGALLVLPMSLSAETSVAVNNI